MDRQLNQLSYHHLRADPQRLMSEGYFWEAPVNYTLGNGGTAVTLFTVGNAGVLAPVFYFSTDGSRGALFDLYVGGDVTPGTPADMFPLNHERPKPNPLAGIWNDSTVNVEGTLIGDRALGDTMVEGELLPLIFAPNQSYYFRVTNLHNQTANISVTVPFAALPPAGLL